jgi:hypothetical protein
MHNMAKEIWERALKMSINMHLKNFCNHKNWTLPLKLNENFLSFDFVKPICLTDKVSYLIFLKIKPIIKQGDFHKCDNMSFSYPISTIWISNYIHLKKNC